MRLFDTWNWDLSYGSLVQKNQLPQQKGVRTNTSETFGTKKGINDTTIDESTQVKTTKTNQDVNASGDFIATDDPKVVNQSGGGGYTKIQDNQKSRSSQVNATEGVDVEVIKNKGFYQDDEAKLQDLRRNSAARQATNSIITMLTGSNAGVLPDQAAAYLQERNAVVDKYNAQMATNDISRTATARNIDLNEQVQESTRTEDSKNWNRSVTNNLQAGGAFGAGATTFKKDNGDPMTDNEVADFVAKNVKSVPGMNFNYKNGTATPTFKDMASAKAFYEANKNSSNPRVKQMAMDVLNSANVAATNTKPGS